MNSIDPQHKLTLRKAFWFYGVGFLGCLYCVAFIAVYTPWGSEFGIALPLSFFHIGSAGDTSKHIRFVGCGD